MNHSANDDIVLVYPVDNSVTVDEYLSDVLIAKFRNDPA